MSTKLLFAVFLMFVFSASLKSQTVVNPNFGLKSHETLDINRIEITKEKTVVSFTIENRIENGTFCADRKIYITDPSGNKLKVITTTGIPVCPDNYIFKKPGEKLSFTLTFPPLTGEPVYIDLKEECSENCFSFYGIVLDEYLNSRLDEGFSLAERGVTLKAMDTFIKMADISAKHNGIRALVYYNIVKLATETGNTVKAGEWYKKLSSMSSRGGKIYIEQLNLQGIRY
ncbi:MAG: hypothetical protein IPN68_12975 [Bacteroidetes bacterium]|nr:hypothetical protein [Bacteroidota bacterium]